MIVSISDEGATSLFQLPPATLGPGCGRVRLHTHEEKIMNSCGVSLNMFPEFGRYHEWFPSSMWGVFSFVALARIDAAEHKTGLIRLAKALLTYCVKYVE